MDERFLLELTYQGEVLKYDAALDIPRMLTR
jgi:hypothetical protein